MHISSYTRDYLHRKKRFTSFPSPAGMSLTKLSLGRNNSVMTSLFPPRESLVVTSRLGTGNSQSFFYGVWHCHWLLAVFLNKAVNSKFLSGTAVTMTVTCRIERVNRGKFRDQFTHIPTEMPLFLVCYSNQYSAHTTGLKHVPDLIAESVDP